MSASVATGIRAAGGVGLFGGTFDPVHLGHLRAAEEVSRALALDRLVFVPSAHPPHKSGENGELIAPAPDRLAWLKLAVADRPGFDVDDMEVERSGPSFAVDTLREFRERGGERPPVFVIGSDAFALIATWRQPETLFELADFAVMTRPPLSSPTLADYLPERFRDAFEISNDGRSGRHRNAGTTLQLVEIQALDISSSSIRERIARGEAVDDLLPEDVCCAVLESRHYGGASTNASRQRETAAGAMVLAELERVEKAREAVAAALDLKAKNPVVLDVRKVSSFADTFVLLTGRSNRQVCSIADAIEERLRMHGERALGIEGYSEGRWVLMDFTDLIVHIFIAEVREHYDLERLWSDAPPLELGIELTVDRAWGQS